MLMSNKATLKWNSKIYKHYINLGYNYTHMGDEFEVDVNDLTNGSYAEVRVKCDYCGKEYNIKWCNYYKAKNKKIIKKDCCGYKDCTTKKSQETLFLKYGTSNIREINGVNEKIKETNLNKYGCENPFANEEIKNKIKKTNLEKYGVESSMQNPNTVKKARETCLLKYGVDNYSKTTEFKQSMTGENNPVWKENPKHERTERGYVEYRDWRKNVFIRDGYTCQCCGRHNHNGNGGTVRLNAHHIYNFKDYKDKAFDLDNGITLCDTCHYLFHSLYGKKKNNPEQLNEFLKQNKQNIDEKIC